MSKPMQVSVGHISNYECSGVSETELPPLTVVVVNWNGKEDLADCFGSLFDGGYPDLRVIMVDNGSKDDSIAWTRDCFPTVEIIDAGSNLRWAAGNNLALTQLLKEKYTGYVLLLNNDTIVPGGSLSRLVAGLRSSNESWAATPRICYAADPARAWYDGGSIGRWSGWIYHDGIRQLTGNLDNTPRHIGYGTGCALLLKPRVLTEIGLLDEEFHFYAEDADYSMRIIAAGGQILHIPLSLVLHKVSASVGSGSPLKAWLRSRSHIHLIGKHWRKRQWPILAITQLAFLSGHATWHLWNGRLETAVAVWQGALDEIQRKPY